MKLLFSMIVICSITFASAQDSLNMIKVGAHDTGSIDYNDVWGYEHDGDQYVVYGARDRVAIVNVSNCNSPVETYVWNDGNSTIWRDFKDHGDYIYAVCDQGSEGLEVILKDSPYTSTSDNSVFTRAHNIFIDNDNERLYVAGATGNKQGLYIYDLSITPEDPPLIGSPDFNDFDGLSGYTNWYVHDVYVRDNIAYCSHGNIGTYGVWDFTDAAAPVLLGTSTGDGLGDYNHSSWVTEDLQYAYVAEEVPQKEMTILNISDVTDIEYVGQFSDPLLAGAPTPPRAHNPFVKGDLLYISYYHDGLMVYDISDRENPTVHSYYDTYPGNTNYAGYEGAWGVYPFLSNGCIAISDIDAGLILLNHKTTISSEIGGADLYFDTFGKGVIINKPDGTYGRITVDNTGAIIVQSMSSLPSSYKELKDSNLFISSGVEGILNTSGGKYFRLNMNNIGNLTSTFVGTIEPTIHVKSKNTDMYVSSLGSALIMKSSDGTCWELTLDLANNILTNSIDCP